MRILNQLAAAALEAGLWPFRALPDWVGLGAVALITAMAVLLVYGRTSNQAGITAVRRSIVAALLEMSLFRNDLVIVFRAQGQVLKDSARYFRYSLAPLAWLIIPLAILFIHLDRIYGFAPLQPGDAVLVEAELRAEREVFGEHELSLQVGPALMVETPPLRIRSRNVVNWRLGVVDEGVHAVSVYLGEEQHTKEVVVGHGFGESVPVRPSGGVIDQLLHPGEPPLPPDAAVARITVHYARANVSFFGWQVHWAVPFLVLTMVFGFALQKPFGVRL